MVLSMYKNSANLTTEEKRFLATQSLRMLIKDEWKDRFIRRDRIVSLLAQDDFVGNAIEMGMIKEILYKEFNIEVIDEWI